MSTYTINPDDSGDTPAEALAWLLARANKSDDTDAAPQEETK